MVQQVDAGVGEVTLISFDFAFCFQTKRDSSPVMHPDSLCGDMTSYDLPHRATMVTYPRDPQLCTSPGNRRCPGGSPETAVHLRRPGFSDG